MEPAGESGLRCLHDEVVVRAHQAEGMADPALAIDRLGQETKEEHPVRVVAEDRVAIDAPCGHVVDPVREVLSQGPRHAPHRSPGGGVRRQRWRFTPISARIRHE